MKTPQIEALAGMTPLGIKPSPSVEGLGWGGIRTPNKSPRMVSRKCIDCGAKTGINGPACCPECQIDRDAGERFYREVK